MEITFVGKRALVTGAGKGIGRAIAKKLAECGAETVVISRTEADLESLKKEVPSILTEVVDLSKWEDTKQKVESLGHFDLLVNNAGVSRLAPFIEVTEEEIDFHFQTNFKGLFNVSQVVAKSMIAQKKGGAIVNMSSIAARHALNLHAVYCSTKSAVDSLTRVMALELGPHQIRVNSIRPTVTMTEMGAMAWSDPKKAKPVLDRTPLGRFAEVEDIVNCVMFLLSDKASFMTGDALSCEGGLFSV